MNRSDMKKELKGDKRKVFKFSSPVFAPLVQHMGHEGYLPHGTAITITGDVGVGKTRYLIQLLKDLAKNNPKMQHCHLYEYEMTMFQTVSLLEQLDPMDCMRADYHFTVKPEFHYEGVTAIDSLDSWARKFENSRWPTTKMAQQLLIAKEKSGLIFQIHHRNKGNRTESGNKALVELTDIIVELHKQKDGTVLATTRRKNRQATGVDQIILEHTKHGLIPKKTVSFKDMLLNLYTRITH